MNTFSLIAVGQQLEDFIGLEKWSETRTAIEYSLDTFSFSIKKEIIVQQSLQSFEIVERMVKSAINHSIQVFYTYDDLPFGELLKTNEEQQLANYILTTNANFAYELIKNNGMNELYQFINTNAVNAINTSNQLISQGKQAVMFETVQRVLLEGVFLKSENEIPLILDFTYEKFYLKESEIYNI